MSNSHTSPKLTSGNGPAPVFASGWTTTPYNSMDFVRSVWWLGNVPTVGVRNCGAHGMTPADKKRGRKKMIYGRRAGKKQMTGQ